MIALPRRQSLEFLYSPPENWLVSICLCFHRRLRVNSQSLVGACLLELHAFFLSYTKQLIFVPQNGIQNVRMLTITEKASNSARKIKTLLKMNPLSNHRPGRTQAPKPPSSRCLHFAPCLPEGHCHSFTAQHCSGSREASCSAPDNSLPLTTEGDCPTTRWRLSPGKTSQERPLSFTYCLYIESAS